MSDGTAAGTHRLTDGFGEAPVSNARVMVATDQFAYLLVEADSFDTYTVWRASVDGVEPLVPAEGPTSVASRALLAASDRVYWIGGDPANLVELRDDRDAAAVRTQFAHEESFADLFGDALEVTDIDLHRGASGVYFGNTDAALQSRLWFVADGSRQSRAISPPCPECMPPRVEAGEGDAVLFAVRETFIETLWWAERSPSSARRVLTCLFAGCGLEVPGFGFLALDPDRDGRLVRVDPRTSSTIEIGESPDLSRADELEAAYLPKRGSLVLNGYGDTGFEPYALDLATGDLTHLGDFNRSRPGRFRFVSGGDQLTVRIDSGLGANRVGNVSAAPLSATAAEGLFCSRNPTVRRVGSRLLCDRDGELVAYDIGPDGALSPPEVLATELDEFFTDQPPPGPNYFRSRLPDQAGYRLHVTDGTPQGTRELAEFTAAPLMMASDDGLTYFVLERDGRGEAIVVSDGTVGGTQVLNTLDPNLFGSLRAGFDTFATERWLYLVDWNSVAVNFRVDREDGTIEQFSFGHPFFGDPEGVVAEGSSLYFATDLDPIFMRFDDSAAEPVYVADVPPLRASPFRAQAVRIPGATVLRTNSSTLMVVDDAGAVSTFPFDVPEDELTAVAGRVVFPAQVANRGEELLILESATAEPRLLHDLFPGPPSSAPDQLTVRGDALFFEADDGIHGRQIWTIPIDALMGDTPACRGTEHSLCLSEGRFKIDVAWQDFFGNRGRGRARSVTDDVGAFWFFSPENLETLVKVLDGRSINEHFWTFFGSISNVAFQLSVTDAENGGARRYQNDLGEFASVGDVLSLDAAGNTPVERTPSQRAAPLRTWTQSGPVEPCREGASFLCLVDGRFEVSVEWRDFADQVGSGVAVPLEADTGAFSFFAGSNLELMIKVLDGREINGFFWVFFGALSNVEYEIQLRDTITGLVTHYRNPLGHFASLGDTRALPGL